MKRFFIYAAVLSCLQSTAQNNPIFGGSSADGWHRSDYGQGVNNIFVGGQDDGWSRDAYMQSLNNIFAGGSGEGWSSSLYSQAVLNIYNGGNGDGWSFTLYAQPVNNIYFGGDGDGWNLDLYAQGYNNVFSGGGGDGWASVYRPLNVLPVTFVSFTAQKQGVSSLLQWQTTNEINSASFEIERSADALRFIKMGTIAAAGNTIGQTGYQFIDVQPLQGFNYYRLKQLDRNGAAKYTPVRLVIFDGSDMQTLKAYPVPATQFITLELPPTLRSKQVAINLTTSNGVMVQQLRLPANRMSDRSAINLIGLSAGMYMLQVFAEGYQGAIRIAKQ